MKNILKSIFVIVLLGILFSSCNRNQLCLECTITIAGIVDDKGKTCGDADDINSLESDYEDIVDRENSIVPMSASLNCIKYVKP